MLGSYGFKKDREDVELSIELSTDLYVIRDIPGCAYMIPYPYLIQRIASSTKTSYDGSVESEVGRLDSTAVDWFRL